MQLIDYIRIIKHIKLNDYMSLSVIESLLSIQIDLYVVYWFMRSL